MSEAGPSRLAVQRRLIIFHVKYVWWAARREILPFRSIFRRLSPVFVIEKYREIHGFASRDLSFFGKSRETTYTDIDIVVKIPLEESFSSGGEGKFSFA